MSQFNPNRLSFEEGVERIKIAVREVDLPEKGIVTSRDRRAVKLRELLAVDNVPDGFSKYQLPFYFDKPSQMYVTIAEPGAVAGRHAHKHGDGIRFIAGGSVLVEDAELTEGDWMFIPAGAEYELEVGPNGAIMCYCYCCSCA